MAVVTVPLSQAVVTVTVVPPLSWQGMQTELVPAAGLPAWRCNSSKAANKPQSAIEVGRICPATDVPECEAHVILVLCGAQSATSTSKRQTTQDKQSRRTCLTLARAACRHPPEAVPSSQAAPVVGQAQDGPRHAGRGEGQLLGATGQISVLPSAARQVMLPGALTAPTRRGWTPAHAGPEVVTDACRMHAITGSTWACRVGGPLRPLRPVPS